MSEVRRQRAVITGAGDGIGRALAIQLNQRGIDLWLCDIDQARLEATKGLLSRSDCQVDLAVVDCGNQVDIETWAARISAEIDELDFLFNNAGVAYGARFEDVSFDNFEWLININFWGVVWCTKAFLPLLTKKRASLGTHKKTMGFLDVSLRDMWLNFLKANPGRYRTPN